MVPIAVGAGSTSGPGLVIGPAVRRVSSTETCYHVGSLWTAGGVPAVGGVQRADSPGGFVCAGCGRRRPRGLDGLGLCHGRVGFMARRSGRVAMGNEYLLSVGGGHEEQ